MTLFRTIPRSRRFLGVPVGGGVEDLRFTLGENEIIRFNISMNCSYLIRVKEPVACSCPPRLIIRSILQGSAIKNFKCAQ